MRIQSLKKLDYPHQPQPYLSRGALGASRKIYFMASRLGILATSHSDCWKWIQANLDSDSKEFIWVK